MLTFEKFCKEVVLDEWNEATGTQGYWYKGKHFEWYKNIWSGGETIITTPQEFLKVEYEYQKRLAAAEERKEQKATATRLVNLLAGIKKSRMPKPVRMIYGNEPEFGSNEWYAWNEHAN